MGEFVEFPADLPPDVEARFQEIMAKTGETHQAGDQGTWCGRLPFKIVIGAIFIAL